jgi:DNA-binding transcriptional regulator YiaG
MIWCDFALRRVDMTTYAESFKREVARVSKKEVRGEITPLRKATTTHRSEIAALKKSVKSLEATVRQLVKLANRSGAASAAAQANAQPKKAAAKPSARGTFDAAAFAEHRKQLGLTQEQWAKIVGVSSLSIYKWEKGGVQPREKQLAAIRVAMSLGKRRALALANG